MSKPDMSYELEFKMRLLSRPNWVPSRFPGTCETCGEQVLLSDPVTLVTHENGERWTCACIFMPGKTIREKLSSLRRADLRLS